MIKIKHSIVLTMLLLINAVAFAIGGVPTVTNLSALAGDGQATVTFTNPDAILYSDFMVTVYPGGAQVFYTSGGAQISIKIPNLNNGLTYQFTVTTLDEFNSEESALSNEVTPCNWDAPMVTTTSAAICDEGTVTFDILFVDRTKEVLPPTYNWYDVDNNLLKTGSSFTTPNLTSSTAYAVSATYMGCETPKRPLSAVVNHTPAKPYVAAQNSVCDSGSFLLQAEIPAYRKADCRGCGDNNTYVWRNADSDSVYNDADFQTPKLFGSTYYSVTASLNGCTSETTNVDVVINNIPSPFVTDSIICNAGRVRLHAEFPIQRTKEQLPEINWYDALDGSIIANGELYITPIIDAPTIYFATMTYMGCESPKVAVQANVIIKPTMPTIMTSAEPCDSGAVLFTLNDNIGRTKKHGYTNYVWTDADYNFLVDGNEYQTPKLYNATGYKLIRNIDGCTPDTVTTFAIIKHVEIPSVTDSMVCESGKVKLHAIAPPQRTNEEVYQVINWYDVAQDGDPIGTGMVFETPFITNSTTYYASIAFSGCESKRVPVYANVIKMSIPFVLSSQEAQCDSGVFTFTAHIPVRKNCRGNCDPNDYVWKDANNEIVSTEAMLTTPMLHYNTEYSVTSSFEGCPSPSAFALAEVIHAYKPYASDSTICGEGTTKLTINNPTSYVARQDDCQACLKHVWRNENGDYLGEGNTFITPFISQNTSFYVENVVGTCTSAQTEVIAHVLNVPAPLITTSPTSVNVCGESNERFTVIADGENLNYLWFAKVGDNIVHTELGAEYIDINIDGKMNGMNIGVVASNICGADTSDLALVTVHPFVLTVSTTATTLEADQTDAIYQWINCEDNSIVEGANSKVFSPTLTGNYAAIVTKNDCADTTACYSITITGIDKTTTSSLTVYPNPAKDMVNISVSAAVNGTISLTDIHGNIVASKAIDGTESSISTSDFASGVYVLKIATPSYTTTKQVVIVK